jgi:hypothetical protein
MKFWAGNPQGSSGFQRTAGILAVIALPLAFASNLLLLMPFGFDLEAASDPVEALNLEADQSSMLRWGLILDLFGYYLLLLPLTLALRQWTRRETSQWMALATVCGIAYLMIGAIGAAGLAAVVPSLIDHYGLATSEVRSAIEVGYVLINDFVVQGLWNTLEVLLLGVWAGWVGAVMLRERRGLGLVSFALAAAAVLDGTGHIFALAAVSDVALSAYLLLAPTWALWLGLAMISDSPVTVKAKTSGAG